jgi:hypothetical protein
VGRKSKSDPLAVDAYLATLPKAERGALEQLRTLIYAFARTPRSSIVDIRAPLLSSFYFYDVPDVDSS